LIELRPYIENELLGLELHIACADRLYYLFKNIERIYSRSKLVENKSFFAYIRELKYEPGNNPIENLLLESNLKLSLKYFHKKIGKTY